MTADMPEPDGPHSGPRMRPPRDLRKAAVAGIEALIVRGKSSRDAILETSERYGVTRRTATRWARLAALGLRQRSEGRRDVLIARQVERLEQAMQRALDFEEVVESSSTDEDGLTATRKTIVKRPDLRAFLAALQEQNRLLGLHPATVEERYQEASMMLMRELFEVLRVELQDRDAMIRVAARVREVQRRLRRLPSSEVVIEGAAAPAIQASDGSAQ